MEIVFVLCMLGGAAALAYRLFGAERRLRRALRGSDATRIADAPGSGPITVVGRLRYLGAPVTAPLGQQSCACYEVIVEQGTERGRGRRVLEEREWSDFLIE